MESEIKNNGVKRPLGVWVIVCVYALSLLLLIPSIIFLIGQNPDFISQFPAIDILFSGIVVVSIFVAIFALFFLKAVSFWLIVGVTVISAAYYLGYFFSGHSIPGSENTSITSKLIEVAIWFGLLGYLWYLKTKGILK